MVIYVYCKSFFKIFHLFHTHIACVLSEYCISCNVYVASVCSKYFIYFRRILLSFHPSVAKVDLDVGLLSEECGSHSGFDVGRRHRSCSTGVGEAGESSERVEEVGAKRCGRGERGAGVDEMGPSHLDGMGSGAEGSGLNASAGSEAGAGGVRIQETRAE